MKFNPEYAALCVRGSADAYAFRPTIETPLAHARMGRSLVGGKWFTVLAYRGTASLRDWLTDVSACRTSLSGSASVKVHEGFYQAHESILPEVTEYLQLNRDFPILLTGHSLGGALAMLTANALDPLGFAIEAVYTFGQPRVGDVNFARRYDASLGSRTWRCVYENDVVPRLPFWCLGYRHAGQEYFKPCVGPARENAPLGFKLASDLVGLYAAWKHKNDVLIHDHFSLEYVEWLAAGSSRTAVAKGVAA